MTATPEHPNRKKRPQTVENLFRPGAIAVVLLGADTESPVLRPTRVHDYHPPTRSLFIAQTSPPLSARPGTNYCLTTVINGDRGECVRIGTEVSVLEGLPSYRLPSGDIAPAVRLLAEGRLRSMNARTAYRLHPHEKVCMDITLYQGDQHYCSGSQFVVYNISIGGAGLVLPKRIAGKLNPLLDLSIGDKMELALVLALDGEDELVAFRCEYQIVRLNRTHSEVSAYIGGRLVGLDGAQEAALGRYIARAQLAGAPGRVL